MAEELGTRAALARFLQSGPGRNDAGDAEIEIDLSEGLEAAERHVSEQRPAGVRLRYGRQPVGRIPPEAGAERLRDVHLRPRLATTLAWPLLRALTWEKATSRAGDPGRLVLELAGRPSGIPHADESD